MNKFWQKITIACMAVFTMQNADAQQIFYTQILNDDIKTLRVKGATLAAH